MDDMSQFDRDCIDGENREWEMQQKDKEIERLKKEVEGWKEEKRLAEKYIRDLKKSLEDMTLDYLAECNKH